MENLLLSLSSSTSVLYIATLLPLIPPSLIPFQHQAKLLANLGIFLKAVCIEKLQMCLAVFTHI